MLLHHLRLQVFGVLFDLYECHDSLLPLSTDSEVVLSQLVILTVVLSVFMVALDVLDSKFMDLFSVLSVDCKAFDCQFTSTVVHLTKVFVHLLQLLQMFQEVLNLWSATLTFLECLSRLD